MQSGRLLATGGGGALIARPPSRAVAELLGVETILPAVVTRSDGRAVSLILGSTGTAIQLAGASDTAIAVGQRVTFTLPAAAARALRCGEDAPPGWNVLPGRVTFATPLPYGTKLTVATPAPIVVMSSWANESGLWAVGDRVTIAFPPDGGHVIVEPAEMSSFRPD
jgi:hypothetical protein